MNNEKKNSLMAFKDQFEENHCTESNCPNAT